MRGIFSMRWVLWLRRCAVAFVLHCSPLSRALCNRREKDRNVLKIKVFYDFFVLNLASTLYVQYF